MYVAFILVISQHVHVSIKTNNNYISHKITLGYIYTFTHTVVDPQYSIYICKTNLKAKQCNGICIFYSDQAFTFAEWRWNNILLTMPENGIFIYATFFMM